VVFVVLSLATWFYTTYVERDCIFVGKRKIFSGRIETENVRLRSTVHGEPFADPPYVLTLHYAHSSNGGRSLIRSQTSTLSLKLGSVFDVKGALARARFEGVLGGLERDAVGPSVG